MQTFRTLVFIRLMMLLMCSSAFGSLIWETAGSNHNVSFSKINTVSISATLPEMQKTYFKKELKKRIGNRANLIIIEDAMNKLSNVLDSQLMIHFVFTTTDQPSSNLLQVYATTQIEIIANKKTLLGMIWNKNYLFEGQEKKDLQYAINKGLELLMNQYFASREQSAKKPTFYLFFNP